MQKYVLNEQQTLSDLPLNIPQKYITILAPTGAGKTHWAVSTLPKLFQHKNIIICVPFQSIAKQKSEYYHINGVYAGSRANSDRVQICVYDCISQFEDLRNTILVVDEYHHLTLSQNYRQPALERILEVAEKTYKTIFLTGTTVETFIPILKTQCEEIVVESSQPKNIEYIAVRPDDILASLMFRFNKDTLNVIYMNKKKMCDTYAQYANTQGYNSMVLSSENKSSQEFQDVLQSRQFPQDINVVFTTAVFSEGIDIEDERPVKLFIVTHEDPVQIRQVVGRFRKKFPEKVYVFYRKKASENTKLLSTQDLYTIYHEKAECLISGMKQLFPYWKNADTLTKTIRENLLFENMLLIKENKRKRMNISFSGLSYLVRRKYVTQLYKHEEELTKEFENYGMYLTAVEEDHHTLSQVEILEEIQETIKQESKDQQEKNLTSKSLNNSFNRKCKEYEITLIESLKDEKKAQEIVKIIREESKGSHQRINRFIQQVNYEIQQKSENPDLFLQTLKNELRNCHLCTAEQIYQVVKKVYSEFAMYNTVYFTQRQAIYIMRSLFVIKRTKKVIDDIPQNVYRIISESVTSYLGITI